MSKETIIVRIYKNIEDLDNLLAELTIDIVPNNLGELIKKHGGDWASITKIRPHGDDSLISLDIVHIEPLRE